MSLTYNNINYKCTLSSVSNNSTILKCVPINIEDTETASELIVELPTPSNPESTPELNPEQTTPSKSSPTTLDWFQLSGMVSGGGGHTPTNVLTAVIDLNPIINTFPVDYQSLFQFLVVANENTPNQVCAKAVNIEVNSSSVVFTFDRNVGGYTPPEDSQTYWFKYITSDGTYYNEGKCIDEFTNFGITDCGYYYENN
jgi:hypothetical protein